MYVKCSSLLELITSLGERAVKSWKVLLVVILVGFVTCENHNLLLHKITAQHTGQMSEIMITGCC